MTSRRMMMAASVCLTACICWATMIGSVNVAHAESGQNGTRPVFQAIDPENGRPLGGAAPIVNREPLIRPIDPETDTGPDLRGGTCVTIWDYIGGPQPIGLVIKNEGGATFPFLYVGDDMNLTGTERLACDVTVRLGTWDTTIAPSFVYRLSFWSYATASSCPDSGGTMYWESADQLAIGWAGPATGIDFTTTVDTTLVLPATVVELVIRHTHPSDEPFVFYNGPPGTAIGTSDVGFYVGYDNGTCGAPGHFLWYGAGTEAHAMGARITASETPNGSCCDRSTGVCAEDVNLGACLDYFKNWETGNCGTQVPTCALCDIVEGAGSGEQTGCNATVNDNEPLCGPDYDDNTNSGCAFSDDLNDPDVTDITCGAKVFGHMGTYAMANNQARRDNDYYRFTLTTTSRVTWTVRSESGANATIFVPMPPTPCDELSAVAGAGTTDGCVPAVAEACLPAGTYYAVARTPTTSGLPCDIPYCAELICDTEFDCSSELPLGACCIPNDCEQRSELHCLFSGGIFRGVGEDCINVDCPEVPDNDSCTSKIDLTGNVIVAFDTTFGTTLTGLAGEANCGTGPVTMFRDLWWGYKVNAADLPQDATHGRLVVSTYDSCVDTRVAVYYVDDCEADQETQCANIEEIDCNEDMNEARGNWASYLVIGSNSPGGTPAINHCFKIRVGVFDNSQANRGEGALRVNFVPVAQDPWNPDSGRCCWKDGACAIVTSEEACNNDGGFFTRDADFSEGDGINLPITGVGCQSLPCPAVGEACYNAARLNGATGGVNPVLLPGDEGTTTRMVTKRTFFAYKVPITAQPGEGIVIHTCGSDFDTVIAVHASGSMDENSGVCTGTPFAINDDCTPAESSAGSAGELAPCFGNNELDSCICLTVPAADDFGHPLFPGNDIFIEVGAFNNIANSTLPSIDPVPQNCGTPVLLSLSVSLEPECFSCVVEAPPNCVDSGEAAVCGTQPPAYQDTINGGCNSDPAVFVNISCDQAACGVAGNFIGTVGTQTANFRDLDWYRLSVPQAKTLHLKAIGGFPPLLILQRITNLGNPCVNRITVATATGAGSCVETNLSAAVCPGEYIVVIAPSIFEGVECDSDYVLEVLCEDPPTQDCCQADMNNDGVRNGRDVRGFVSTLVSPPTNIFPVDGCFNANMCRGDMNGDYQVNMADVIPFVNLLLTVPPCPASNPCSDPARCHLTDSSSGDISALSGALGCSLRTTDDFRPSVSGIINQVCWHGFYRNLAGGSVCDPQDGTGDSFTITFFNDNAGVPGGVHAGPFAGLTLSEKVADGTIPAAGGFGESTQWRYKATLPAGVNVTAGNCYWIEIVNNASGACCWLWSFSERVNDVSASRSGGPAGTPNYTAANLLGGDFAFCLDDIRIDKLDCGLPLGRCCYRQGNDITCVDNITDPECTFTLNGFWSAGLTCATQCPPFAPDACVDAVQIALNTPVAGTTVGLTPSPGLVPSCESTGSGQNNSPDGWYKVTAPAAGPITVTACLDTPNTYDMIMVAYATCEGPEVACDDDACGGGGTSRVQWTATANTTYLIRVTGWHGASGNFTIRATQP